MTSPTTSTAANDGVPFAKLAPTDHPIDALLRARWSPRAFSDRAIAEPDLRRLLEAARWAPSCSNEQPWRFIVGRRTESEAFERIFSCLTDGNRKWAGRAAVLLVSVAKLMFDRHPVSNRHAWHDTGLALAQLLVQATSMGLVGHPMAGFDAEALREACGIPEGFEPVAVTALGYLGDPALLDEVLRARELASRQRHTIDQLAFGGQWAHAL